MIACGRCLAAEGSLQQNRNLCLQAKAALSQKGRHYPRASNDVVCLRWWVALLPSGHVRTAAANALGPAQVPTGTALIVADQNEVLQTLMAASGEQAKLGSKVTYANFLGGPAILEAFRAGALDLATVGNTPPIQAQAAGERNPDRCPPSNRRAQTTASPSGPD